jgi:purine-binding chemotaxis protein CheW
MTELIEKNKNMEYVTFDIGGHTFGLDVVQVRDVFRSKKITNIPQSGEEVFGVLNLRGRIVTVINLYHKLGFPIDKDLDKLMNIVVEYNGESYAFLIDKVGDVMSLTLDTFEEPPRTMSVNWKNMSKGIHRLEDKILILLDIEKVLNFIEK